MKKDKIDIFFFSLVLILTLNGSSLVSAENSEEIVPFVYAVHAFPPAFDPQNFYDTTSSDIAINHLEGLYAHNYTDPQMSLIPRLAADLGTWNENGTEWTIPLREDVLWHDGTPFTASDVKWNWDRLNYLADDHVSQHASLWFNNEENLMMEEIIIIDEYTIKFVLDKPWMDFFYLQTFSGCFLIKPVEGKEEVLIENDDYDLLVGTGPFILSNVTRGKKTEFLANNRYYRGAPDIQKLIFQVYASSTASNNALMTHECHVDGYVRPDNRMAFSMDQALRYGILPGTCCYFYHLNVDTIVWSVRKAMQYAFNYEYLATEFYNNLIIEHHSPVPSRMIGYNPDLPGLPYYNLSLARQYILDDPIFGDNLEAAIAGGFNTSNHDDWISLATGGEFGTFTGPLANLTVTHYGNWPGSVLIDSMRYIGINIENNVIDPDCTFSGCYRNPGDLYMGASCSDYWHPVNQIEPLFASDAPEYDTYTSGMDYYGIANSTIDAMMEETHILSGVELELKIDEIVTAIIVEQAAAMYWGQNQYTLGWSSKYVSNVHDLFNAQGDKYFYNVDFALSEAPTDGLSFSIPGYSIFPLIFIGVLSTIYLKRRNKKSEVII